MFSLRLFTCDGLNIGRRENKNRPASDELNVTCFRSGGELYIVRMLQERKNYLPFASFVSLVLLNISGLRIALINLKPLGSPFS